MFQKKLRINKIYEYDKFYRIYAYAINDQVSYLAVLFKNSGLDASLIKEKESIRFGLEKNPTTQGKFDGEQVIVRDIL